MFTDRKVLAILLTFVGFTVNHIYSHESNIITDVLCVAFSLFWCDLWMFAEDEGVTQPDVRLVLLHLKSLCQNAVEFDRMQSF